MINDLVGGDVLAIRAAARAFVARQARHGVRYSEVRYDPVRLASSGFLNVSTSLEEAVMAVKEGLLEGSKAHKAGLGRPRL